MNKEIIVKENKTEQMIIDINNTNKMCQALLQSPHYKRIGAEGIFAIVEKAKSVGVSPLDALNGGMYYVQGKVEMSSAMMNQMIRQNGHSISKDKKSDSTVCTLIGKRSDNGDVWEESFSIEEAKLAGIYKHQWLKYPKDMLFARALSRLARQLFPDVIKGCYVQGEISDAPSLNSYNDDIIEEEKTTIESISNEQYEELEEALGDNIALRQNLLAHMKKKWSLNTLSEMPVSMYPASINSARSQAAKKAVAQEDQKIA